MKILFLFFCLLIIHFTNETLNFKQIKLNQLSPKPSKKEKKIISFSKTQFKFKFENGLDLINNHPEFEGTDCAFMIGKTFETLNLNGIQMQKNKNSWNAWEAQRSCKNKLLQALVIFACAAIDPQGKIISEDKRTSLGKAIMDLYNPIWSVPYHNAVHASDLVQKDIFFMEYRRKFENGGEIHLRDYLEISPLEYLALIIGGAGHDSGHSGDSNQLAREYGTFVGQHYNGILELYSCDLMMGLLIGESKLKNHEDLIFHNLFDENLKIDDLSSSDKKPFIKEIGKKAVWGVNILREKYKEGFLEESLKEEDIKKFLGIIRHTIYSTIVNPFDYRLEDYWKMKAFLKGSFGKVKDSNSKFDYEDMSVKMSTLILKPIEHYYESSLPMLEVIQHNL